MIKYAPNIVYTLDELKFQNVVISEGYASSLSMSSRYTSNFGFTYQNKIFCPSNLPYQNNGASIIALMFASFLGSIIDASRDKGDSNRWYFHFKNITNISFSIHSISREYKSYITVYILISLFLLFNLFVHLLN